MSDTSTPTGPDLERGIAATDVREGEPLVGQAHGEAILLVRERGKLHAVAATCTHYGGPLGEGLVSGGTVRCPWHHACFDLATGKALSGPALSGIACFDVVESGGTVKVGAKRSPA